MAGSGITITIEARNGERVRASIEAWVFGILAALPDAEQQRVMERVKRAVASQQELFLPRGIISVPAIESPHTPNGR